MNSVPGQSTKRKVDKIVVHCSDTYKNMDIGADVIRKWHVEERGWKDIGYHFVIRRDGEIELGRDLDKDGDVFEEIGAHVSGMNKHSIGVCLVGGKSDNGQAENNFTDKQFKSLELLLRMIRVDYKDATVHGHNEFSHKQCPAFDVQKWIREVNIL